jgi:hypothetical protein
MLIKIGNCWVDPLEIAMISGIKDSFDDVHPQICVHLRHGSGTWIEATMDEAEAALIDAGVIEGPYPEEAGPELSEAERAKLADLYDRDFEYLARDKDGKLYAFHNEPEKEGAYWSALENVEAERIDESFDFIAFEDENPWSIPYLLLGP